MERPVVLDTNVFVAAGFNPHSSSARIVERVRTGELRMVWNEETRGETKAVLQRIPPLSWETLATLFRDQNRHSGQIHPEEFLHVPDAADRTFAALARASDAVLVTLDDDLLAGRERSEIPIVTAEEFEQRYGGRPRCRKRR